MATHPCRVVVTINRKKSLVVSVEDRGTFEVVLHRVWKGSHQDFLGFYVLDSHQMSRRTHGLLGMAGQAGRAVGWGVEVSGLAMGQLCSRAPGQAHLQHGLQGSELQRGIVLVSVLSLKRLQSNTQ